MLCYAVAVVTVLLRLVQDNCVMLTVVLKRTHEAVLTVDRLLLGRCPGRLSPANS